MKKRARRRVCALVLSLNLLAFPSQAEEHSQLLPLKRVRLYEVGVGYFERSGSLRDHSDLGLSLPQSQLDDALGSLVILGGAGKARISGIEFESRDSTALARAEAALPADPAAALEFASVLRSFRGIEVEVRQRGTSVRGRLVDLISLAQASAEHCAVVAPAPDAKNGPSPPPSACVPARDASLVVLSADGTLSRLVLSEVASVRALDAGVASRLARALDAVAGRSTGFGHEILHLHGSGSAVLTLGYVAEAPIFRPSYRLVLDAAGKAGKLQGFALIHNDTDEAWRGVKLELVNGRPSSFLYPLAAPRYARRPLVTPSEPLTTVPQLLRRTPDDAWAPDPDQISGEEIGDAFGSGGLGLTGTGEGGGGRGEGIGLGSVGTIGHGAGASDVLGVGNLTNLSSATGVEGAAQFLYALGAPIDLGAHASALVPFVDESLTLTRVTWFGDDDNGETAVRLVNSSTQTLPAGVLSVFSEAGFSGSSLLSRTKPGQTRVLRFGRDLDVTLERAFHDQSREPRRYAFEAGQLSEHDLRKSQVRCKLENQSVAERTVSVALNIVANARVEGADDAAYDSALGRAIVSLHVPAGANVVRELNVTEGIVTPIPTAEVTAEFLKHAAALDTIAKPERLILQRAADALYQSEIRRGALPKRKAEIEEALSDATRFESHVRALGPSSDEGHLAAEHLRRTEEHLSVLRQRVRALESEVTEYEARARAALEGLGHGAPLNVEQGLEPIAHGGG
jgi:hypothetical protein